MKVLLVVSVHLVLVTSRYIPLHLVISRYISSLWRIRGSETLFRFTSMDSFFRWPFHSVFTFILKIAKKNFVDKNLLISSTGKAGRDFNKFNVLFFFILASWRGIVRDERRLVESNFYYKCRKERLDPKKEARKWKCANERCKTMQSVTTEKEFYDNLLN